MKQDPELNEALKKFRQVLRQYPDREKDYMEYKYFLRSFIKIRPRSAPLPTTAVISVIRHERPETFRLVRDQMREDPTFYF